MLALFKEKYIHILNIMLIMLILLFSHIFIIPMQLLAYYASCDEIKLFEQTVTIDHILHSELFGGK